MNKVETLITKREDGGFARWTLVYLGGELKLLNGSRSQIMNRQKITTWPIAELVICQLTEYECSAGLEIKKWDEIEFTFRRLIDQGVIK